MLWQRADPAELMKRRKGAGAGTRVASHRSGSGEGAAAGAWVGAPASNNTRQLLSV